MAINNKMKIKREAKEAEEPTKAERKKETKEKLTRGGKIALVAVGCAAMLLSVSAMACSGVLNEVKKEEAYHLTGGVAATVNGTNITEDTITNQIMSYRNSAGYTEDADWAKFLVDQGTTPEAYRENMIRSVASNFLIDSAVREYDITVSDEEVDAEFERSAESYGGVDKMMEILQQIGYTEQAYKDSLRSSMQKNKLREKVAAVDAPSDAEVLEYFNQNIDTYNDARRSENLLIKVASDASDEDKQKAKDKTQEILDKINAGEVSFEDAVKEYSDDTASAKNGGDVGYDKLTSFVTEYQDALGALQKDQISGIVETTYGYHIIKCTDVFKVEGQATSIDQLPAEIRDYIVNIIESNAESDAYNTWLNDYTDKAEIKINEMPSDVPYNVDLSKAAEAKDEDKAQENPATTADESAEKSE
ncbi:peptidylprolyl isomerase [Collinsella sp. BA40]|uniref:peptidylprolyl isomerase n=1 Tax=Collinsella sp. BA40 TaxID=2560852 RepID=UPI0011CB8172|nr:peptidylprolyl isomerase [Collinsella sp. BA40]TXF38565.1 peptidylprolyl isomerase [Collinsella sp. BA40]